MTATRAAAIVAGVTTTAAVLTTYTVKKRQQRDTETLKALLTAAYDQHGIWLDPHAVRALVKARFYGPFAADITGEGSFAELQFTRDANGQPVLIIDGRRPDNAPAPLPTEQ